MIELKVCLAFGLTVTNTGL